MSGVQLQLLAESDYEEAYSRAFIPAVAEGTLSAEELSREFEAIDSAIRRELSARWEEDEFGEADYAISDEWSGCRHHCGGIYSDRIIGPDYPEVLIAALKSVPNGELWTYHTTIEPQEGRHALIFGGFFVRGGILYAPATGTGYDYRKTFARASNKSG